MKQKSNNTKSDFYIKYEKEVCKEIQHLYAFYDTILDYIKEEIEFRLYGYSKFSNISQLSNCIYEFIKEIMRHQTQNANYYRFEISDKLSNILIKELELFVSNFSLYFDKISKLNTANNELKSLLDYLSIELWGINFISSLIIYLLKKEKNRKVKTLPALDI